MDDFEDNRWKEKKITDFFRQVKPRSKSSWPAAPAHAVIVPPAAIPIEPFDPELNSELRSNPSHRDSETRFPPHETQTFSGSSSAPNATVRTVTSPRSIGFREGVIPCTISTGRSSSFSVHGCKSIGLGSPHCCSTGDPSTKIFAKNQGCCASHCKRSDSSHPTAELRTGHSMPNSRPRKRFRKKVNGLFGENTDLHKRMTKLIRTTDMSKITVGRDAADADLLVRKRKPVGALFETESLLATLPKESSSDSFDFVELTSAATKALGSPERLANVRSSIGTLDPVHNKRFLDELDLGPNEIICGKDMEKKPASLQPPTLPPLDASSLCKAKPVEKFPRSLISRRRTILAAIPAILRSRTRRAERGYRSKDVLRARLQTSKTSIDPPVYKDNTGSLKDLRTPENMDITEEIQRLRENRKRPAEESLRNEIFVRCSQSVDGDDDDENEGGSHFQAAKKRRKKGQDPRANEADLEASPVTMANSDRENDVDDRRIMQNPLTMLVEAATGNCSLQNDEVHVNLNRDAKCQRGSGRG